jgi:hypothetical protein
MLEQNEPGLDCQDKRWRRENSSVEYCFLNHEKSISYHSLVSGSLRMWEKMLSVVAYWYWFPFHQLIDTQTFGSNRRNIWPGISITIQYLFLLFLWCHIPLTFYEAWFTDDVRNCTTGTLSRFFMCSFFVLANLKPLSGKLNKTTACLSTTWSGHATS